MSADFADRKPDNARIVAEHPDGIPSGPAAIHFCPVPGCLDIWESEATCEHAALIPTPDDWEPLGEDVSMHTMLGFFTHDDGRGCMYHSRLGAWATGWPIDKRCLRDDHPDPYRRAVPTDGSSS